MREAANTSGRPGPGACNGCCCILLPTLWAVKKNQREFASGFACTNIHAWHISQTHTDDFRFRSRLQKSKTNTRKLIYMWVCARLCLARTTVFLVF